jgi:predicted MFS family arabinose efflux permease
VLLTIGGTCVVAGYIVLTVWLTPVGVIVAAGLLGVSWALGHTTIQTWMTDAATGARAIGMALFSIALFTGASIGAAFGGLASDGHAFGVLFAAAAIAAVPFAILTSAGRARYRVADQ